MIAPIAARLGDGHRLHLQHGPIDLIIEVTGPPAVVDRAEAVAWQRFTTVLDELVPQLSVLRAPVVADAEVHGTIAARMLAATARYTGVFLTPMAAVAGSIAQEICEAIDTVSGVRRVYVNNGGDVALSLAPGETYSVGLVAATDADVIPTSAKVTAESGVGGIATSGWGGRSFSLGIADSVTVFAAAAADADVTASLIGNAVDLPGHPAVERLPAVELEPDSDLGARLVTVSVGALEADEVAVALDRGMTEAKRLLTQFADLRGAVLTLQGQQRSTGFPTVAPSSRQSPPRPRVKEAHHVHG